ncbi:MAG: undecaprenyl-phosphate glucose phosphotransferase [Alphaproteobacteria bacterium]|nr:MAG: undecaprenyl-phosphate glucose phosphotransferase [Alphaproteobacteria bacterium]
MVDSEYPAGALAERQFAKASRGRAFWRSDARVSAMYFVDLCIILLAAQGAWMLRFGFGFISPDYILVTLLACLGWAGFAARSKVYDIEERRHIFMGIRRVAASWVYVALGVAALAFATKSGSGFSRLWAGFFFAAAGGGLLMARFGWNLAVRRAELAGHFCSQVAVVGDDMRLVRQLMDMFERGDTSVAVTGLYTISDDKHTDGDNAVAVRGSIGTLVEDYHACNYDSVWLALDWDNPQSIEHVRAKLSVLPCEIHAPILPVAAAFPGRAVGQHAGVPAVTLGRRPLSSTDQMFKRAEDLILGSLFLLMASPVLLLIAFLIKIDSPGPVFFRQQRHGFANATFRVYKFRTMYNRPPEQNAFKQAVKNDPRVTRLGRILRRTSLDELPQLLNVIQGDMSLVGPRPHPVALSHQFLDDVEEYLARHKMKPGITGWAQIHGLRGETETLEKMTKRVECDLWYVDHWSVWLDLRIIFMTLPSLLDKNAY